MQVDRTDISTDVTLTPTRDEGDSGRQPGGAPAAAPSRRRVYAAVVPLLVLLILWIWLFDGEGAFKGGPGGKAFGGDWAMFVAAAQVLKAGGDPYHPATLYSTEAAMMDRQHLPMIKPSERAQVRVGNPPLLYWALQPLTDRPFPGLTLAFLLLLYLLSAVGFVACLRYFGWTSWFVPTLIFLLMPQVVLGAFYGNVICIVFAAVGLSLAVSSRSPTLAGALMSLAWLKPPIALPVALLLFLFHVRDRRRFAAGFVGMTGAFLGLTLLATGPHSLALWVQGLVRYSNDMAIQPDVISLSGLYSRWMPSTPRLALEALTLAAALALTGYYALHRATDSSFLSIAPLWLVWMLAAPYGHFFDEAILAVPMLAFLGRNGYRVAWRLPATALYLAFFSLLVISWAPFRVYLLPIPLLGILACLLRSERDPRFALA